MNSSYQHATLRNRIGPGGVAFPSTDQHRIVFAEPLPTDGSLCGRVALLSGSMSQIAQDLAIDLANRGATIGIIHEAHDQSSAHVADSINATGGKVSMIPGSLLDEAACDGLASRVFEIFGAVDILIHTSDCRMTTPLHRLHRREWDSMVRDSLGSAYNLTRAFINPMRHRQSGRVIFVVEVPVSSETPSNGMHPASECAIEGLARELSVENASRGITVNCVVAGCGTDGVAPLVSFLSSDDAARISGQVITVSGKTSI